ncbi:4-hydroxy-tetrahydrodipicolinate synthase [Proteinivorax hydrogeniformans]|uniref:4-hydroxy-tetrahydrodipicolinate synthase n=1 Tax=Proteinivorax hydrogeniformans TaxID=1826727 RepID=A0AAU8HNV1_9FIRM
MFGEVLTAMVTPFDENGKLNLKTAQRLARHLIKKGNDGLVLAGTTGESPTLTLEEKIDLVDAVCDEIKGSGKILVGTGSNSTKETIETTKIFEQNTNIDGVMVVTPYYNKPTQQGIVDHYFKISAVTSLPIMIYNVPKRTGTNIEAQTVKQLATMENIVAIKEASGDLNQISNIHRICKNSINIYSGEDHLTLPMLAVGSKGVVSVAGHVVSQYIKEMITEFSVGNTQNAQKINSKLLPVYEALFMESNPIPVKKAVELLGFEVGNCRPPLTTPTKSTIESLKNILKEL